MKESKKKSSPLIKGNDGEFAVRNSGVFVWMMHILNILGKRLKNMFFQLGFKNKIV
jgi:hypothetical protein